MVRRRASGPDAARGGGTTSRAARVYMGETLRTPGGDSRGRAPSPGASFSMMEERLRRDGRRTVIHIITQLDRGGSARNTFFTVLGHDQNRFRVGLVYGRSAARSEAETSLLAVDLQALRRAGVTPFEVSSLTREISALLDVRATLSLWRLLRWARPDIVHTHTSKAGAVGRIAAWLARIPLVIHTPHGHIFYGYYGSFMSWVIRLVERVLAQMTDRIVTLTDRGAREHVQYRIAGPAKFVTIPSGIVLSTIRSVRVDPVVKRKELGLPEKGPVIGTVGRLVPIKGHEWLLRAAPRVLAEFPHATVVLIGDGPLMGALRQLAEELGVGRRVLFLGERQDVPECLAACDLFAFPSLNEGMGRALIEAMAAGLPVVATDVGGIPDIVVDGESGALVPPKDPAALADAILALLRDPERRRACGEAAKRRVDDRFDVTAMVRAIERLYDDVWDAKHAAL
ncbi:MAG: glycosyltransferase family 1 protein [Nitrospirae bacterium]|nr:MAG: glycosyltransferase family 1 protein [Nitrospirota bacterium]